MKIYKIDSFPFLGFEKLKEESLNENFNFLNRLEEDWKTNKNRFAKSGEALYSLYLNEELIAIGGVNIDPYANDSKIGRLRRFYVQKSYRKQGIGSYLVNHIISESKSNFEQIRLRTDNEIASKFYLSLGFEKIIPEENATHLYRL